MSWITDLLGSLTTCLQKTWMRPSYNPPESRMEMGLNPQGETEDLFDISLDTGTPPLSRWSSSNSTSKCQSISLDSTCVTAWPALTSSPPDTPSLPKQYYEPDVLRGQSKVNNQGSEGTVDVGEELGGKVTNQLSESFELYQDLLDRGACREQARGNLPQSTYTEFYWKINLHNLMHYLHLRMDEHAQMEIRHYANAIYELVQPLVPVTMEAFKDFRINAMHLTGPEIESIASGKRIDSPGERREFEEKLKRLNINL